MKFHNKLKLFYLTSALLGISMLINFGEKSSFVILPVLFGVGIWVVRVNDKVNKAKKHLKI